MIVEPELLLLDEPFGALDECTKEGMKKLLLQAVAQTGCTVIFVTHGIQDAIFLADRVVFLSKRPATILEDKSIKSPKPQPREFLRSEEFATLHESSSIDFLFSLCKWKIQGVVENNRRLQERKGRAPYFIRR